MISLTINGQNLEAQEGSTVLQVAERAGIIIPTLCYHKDLSPYGGCRLCLVEVQSSRLPSTSCNLLVSQGMVVQTESPALTQSRRSVLEMLLRNFYDGGYKHSNGTAALDEDTQFSYWVRAYGIDMKSAMAQQPFYPMDSDPNPYVWVDKNKCILCDRCVRACAEVQGRFVWEQAFRGYKASIVSGAETTMLQARCESCGACVAYCPTGALDNKMSVSLGRADKSITTTCAYCSVGCQFKLEVKTGVPGGRVIRVISDPAALVNGMHLCVKGRYGYDFIHRCDRLSQPRVRKYLLDDAPRPKNRGPWVDVDWDVALDMVAKHLVTIKKNSGPESIGLLTSGKALNEENYLMNKLARQVLGTHNIDCCAHLHSTSTVAGLEASFGLAAMSTSLDEIANHARSMLIIGSDITEQQPVFGAKIRQAVLRRGVKVVAASSSFVNIEEYASLQMRYKPGTETALVNGLINIIMERGWEDRGFIKEHTEGIDQIETMVAKYPPATVAEITGLPVATLYKAAEILATNRPMAVIWGTGIAHPVLGSRNIISLANLQMLLGNMTMPGGGIAPLRSQANSQGACDMGGLPDFYSGYQPVAESADRQKFEMAWGVTLPARPGLPAAGMLAAARQGTLKALYILGEDLITDETAISTRTALQATNFVVVQEVFPSQSSYYADVQLPGVSFAEKTGTFTNTERRIQMVRQAIEPVGESRPDWQIVAELARRILSVEGRPVAAGAYAGWAYVDTSQIMEEVEALTPIYAGVSHQRLEHGDCLLWPEEVLFKPEAARMALGQFSYRRGRFIPTEYVSPDDIGLLDT